MKCPQCGVNKEPSEFYKGDYYCKICSKDYKILYKKNNPRKHGARELVKKARQEGLLVKPKICSVCGKEPESKKIDGHHEDYEKPLDVIWCCKPCHRQLDFARMAKEEYESERHIKKIIGFDIKLPTLEKKVENYIRPKTDT